MTSLLLTPALAAPVQPKAQQIALAHAVVTPTAFQAAAVAPETVTIVADYLYKRDLKVQAYDLNAFLKARISNLEELAQDGAQIMFWCLDGYAPTAKLSDVLGKGGLIATGDADVAGGRWPDAPYKNTVLSAPAIGNYVVWRTAQFPAKPHPWGLETIYILPAGAVLKKSTGSGTG
ncbi:hypothetical protein [Deinococcus sp. QL22]|uniref:hypothetical protein n=1 Tax=Deinococcus sp. QL22 TaxID=2939437 RepID=UPI002017A565|nr:hypothetical protein [Deinococcus sp. QL22]UQN08284.1 hypothetical protein M1R55_16215 [Deinococcus sp. QL22]